MGRFLTGLLAGIAIGVLMAPDKGTETRKKVSRKAADLKDQLNDFIDNASDTLQAVKDRANDFIHKTKRKGQDYKSSTPPPSGWNA